MEIEVRETRGGASVEIREWAERRVLFAVGQFSTRVRSVAVLVGDENGPRGGIDQTCRMQARLDHGGPIVVEVADADPLAAISRAAERLGRRVRTFLDRERSARRGEGARQARRSASRDPTESP